MDNLNYKGKDYKSVDLTLSTGEYFCYAEVALSDAMEENNDWGCSLDDQICYYPDEDEIVELDKLVSSGASDKEIIDFCNSKSIYIGDYTID